MIINDNITGFREAMVDNFHSLTHTHIIYTYSFYFAVETHYNKPDFPDQIVSWYLNHLIYDLHTFDGIIKISIQFVTSNIFKIHIYSLTYHSHGIFSFQQNKDNWIDPDKDGIHPIDGFIVFGSLIDNPSYPDEFYILKPLILI